MPNNVPLNEMVAFYQPDKINFLMSKAACFISDYSGLIFDWLCFNRPIIHFVFDKCEYLESRNLYNSIEEIQFGPIAYTTEEFVKILTNDTWQDKNKYLVNRKKWMEVVFPDLSFGFAQRGFEVICRLRSEFDDKTRKFISATR